jgi:asparagine N-glycosylation enzyme membrane subunit Stt3
MVVGTVVSAVMMALVSLPSPGWVVDPVTHIPTGDLFPGYLRLLTPFFNITGAFALVLGGIYSMYIFMPKRRVIRYSLSRNQSPTLYLGNLVVAPVAIVLNLAISIPGALVALVTGRLPSRVPATLLIAVGGLIPAITSGLNRFGDTSGFFVGELLGVIFLFAGFLVSIEVFREIRVPFTGIVLRSRTPDEIA